MAFKKVFGQVGRAMAKHAGLGVGSSNMTDSVRGFIVGIAICVLTAIGQRAQLDAWVFQTSTRKRGDFFIEKNGADVARGESYALRLSDDVRGYLIALLSTGEQYSPWRFSRSCGI